MARSHLYDAHCHLHEFGDPEIERFMTNGYIIIAVSDDLNSSLRTLDIYRKYVDNVIPCVGLHPWNIEKESRENVDRLINLIDEEKPPCIGEVGIDRRFLPESSFEKQTKIFGAFLEAASSIDAVVNIHAVDAWRDALRMVISSGVKRAIFHWFNGPEDVLREIIDTGYMVSINAAIKVQDKHKRIARLADLNNILVESDGPYNYRGIRLSPDMLGEALSIIAEVKGISREDVERAVERNFRRYIYQQG
ncbi:MAG TPA: TatD family hydrolase [Sulfolobales archaeon]|nr:TatD family hydrolase [Sulfolobales archaeon]